MSDQSSIQKSLTDSLYSKLSLNIPNKPPILVATFCQNILKLLRTNSYQNNRTLSPILICLNPDQDGKGLNIFSSDLLLNFFEKGQVKNCNILVIDIDGNQINSSLPSNLIIKNIEELNEIFPNCNFIFLFIEGNSIDVIKDCKIFKSIPDIFSLQKTRAYKNLLPISEYTTLINNHYKEEIIGQRGFSYWENKLDRILVSKPEVNFRKRLAAFLSFYVGDGSVDQESLNAGTEDKTDIRITSFENEVYIIEIKWLGKCRTHCQYDGKGAHIRANEGIQQLEIYLKTESRCIKAILVVYDARLKNEKLVWAPEPSKWHKVIDRNPFILYLDSESASTKASKTVRRK